MPPTLVPAVCLQTPNEGEEAPIEEAGAKYLKLKGELFMLFLIVVYRIPFRIFRCRTRKMVFSYFRQTET